WPSPPPPVSCTSRPPGSPSNPPARTPSRSRISSWTRRAPSEGSPACCERGRRPPPERGGVLVGPVLVTADQGGDKQGERGDDDGDTDVEGPAPAAQLLLPVGGPAPGGRGLVPVANRREQQHRRQ